MGLYCNEIDRPDRKEKSRREEDRDGEDEKKEEGRNPCFYEASRLRDFPYV